MPSLHFHSLEEQRAYLAPRITRWYPSFVTGGTLYTNLLAQLLNPSSVVLDAGCGAGGLIGIFSGKVARLIGQDINVAALAANTLLNERIAGDLTNIPLADQTIDVVTAEFVLEHLEHPRAAFASIARVLKPGGSFVALTPNVMNPLMGMSSITPHKFHEWLRQHILHRPDHAHETYYRANTVKTITRLAHGAGLRVETIQRAGNPEYLAFGKPLAVPAIFLERLIARPPLHMFQMYLVVHLMKP